MDFKFGPYVWSYGNILIHFCGICTSRSACNYWRRECLKNYLQGLLQLENQINIARGEFTEEKKWKMEVLPDLNLVRFNTPDIMFEKSSPELSDDFKKILTEFFPDILKFYHFGDAISSKIEGHTSSEWSGSSKEQAFIRNMFLSQQRTQAVFGHSMTICFAKKMLAWSILLWKKFKHQGCLLLM